MLDGRWECEEDLRARGGVGGRGGGEKEEEAGEGGGIWCVGVHIGCMTSGGRVSKRIIVDCKVEVVDVVVEVESVESAGYVVVVDEEWRGMEGIGRALL